MRVRVIVGMIVLLLAGWMPGASSAAAAAGDVALWETDFSPAMSLADCERWRLDDRGFCVANDARNGVELGTKFQTSQRLDVTGVRLYRVDLGTVTGSLWDGDGRRLATGTFGPAAAPGWQDLRFADPVRIVPGRTYVVSYHSPDTKYAFAYGYHREQLTRGPVTALRSVAGDPNGVHCYDSAQCRSFPTNAFRDSGYWISPLWQNPSAEPVPPPATLGPSTDATPPSVRRATPRQGARRVSRHASIKVIFTEAVRSTLLTASTVRLTRKGSRTPIRARLRYDPSRSRLVITPVRALRPRTAYRLTIASTVADVAGNPLDQAARLTFRTR